MFLPNLNIKVGHGQPSVGLDQPVVRANIVSNQRYKSPQAPRMKENMFSPYSQLKDDPIFKNTKLRASSNMRLPNAAERNPFGKMTIQGQSSRILDRNTAAMS